MVLLLRHLPYRYTGYRGMLGRPPDDRTEFKINCNSYLYFVHKEFEEIIFHLVKRPKMVGRPTVGWRGRIGFGKFSYVKKGRAILHSKDLYTTINTIMVTNIVIHKCPEYLKT